VRRYRLAVQYQIDVAKLLAARLQKRGHIILQRRAQRLVKLHVDRMLRGVDLLANDLDEQRLVQRIEFRRHHNVVALLVVLDDEAQTVVLDQSQVQFVGVAKGVQHVFFGYFEFQVLDAELLEAWYEKLDGQLVDVHHEDDFGVGWVLDCKMVKLISVPEV
jgi:hypothetical protein